MRVGRFAAAAGRQRETGSAWSDTQVEVPEVLLTPCRESRENRLGVNGSIDLDHDETHRGDPEVTPLVLEALHDCIGFQRTEGHNPRAPMARCGMDAGDPLPATWIGPRDD